MAAVTNSLKGKQRFGGMRIVVGYTHNTCDSGSPFDRFQLLQTSEVINTFVLHCCTIPTRVQALRTSGVHRESLAPFVFIQAPSLPMSPQPKFMHVIQGIFYEIQREQRFAQKTWK